MSLDWDSAEEGTSSSPVAGTSQVPQEPPEASEEPNCAVCRDTGHEVCDSSCTHCFCVPCIEQWSRSQSGCSGCRQPLRHQFPQLETHSPDVYSIMPNTNRRRARRRSARRRSRRSSGRWHRSNSSRNRGRGRGGAPWRSRSRNRTVTWFDEGRGQAEQDWDYRSPASRRQQRRRAWDSIRDQGQAPWPRRDTAASSRRSQRHQPEGWDASRQRPEAGRESQHRFHSSRDRAWREPSQGPRRGWRRQSRDRDRSRAWEIHRSRSPRRGREIHRATDNSSARWRSRSRDEGRALRPERDVPASSRRSRSRRRSRRRSRSARRQRQRRRDWDERRAQSPEREDPGYSRRREHHQWGHHDSSRPQHAARSRSRHRSRSRARRRAW